MLLGTRPAPARGSSQGARRPRAVTAQPGSWARCVVPGQPTTLGGQSVPTSPHPIRPLPGTSGKASMWPAMDSTGGGRARVPVSGDNVDGSREGQEAGPDTHFSGRGWPLKPTAATEAHGRKENRPLGGRPGSSLYRAFWIPGADCGTSPRKDGGKDARTVTGTSLHREPEKHALLTPRPPWSRLTSS